MKKHNFYAGPSILPEFTINETAKAVVNFSDTGLSVMEVSHRSKEFVAVVDEATELFKELLNIPDNYSILFLGGGASTQFAMVPFNLFVNKAAYLNTGAWSKKAIKEAKMFGEVEVVGSSEDRNFNYIPKGYTIPQNADYFHITTNNTIYGTEIKHDIESPVPLVADMSSDIFSRPIDIKKYAIIYGGAQKNLAPAGVTFVIIKNDILGKVKHHLPTMLNYQTHIDKESMFNTPPVLPIFAALQTLKWLKKEGGIESAHKRNIQKAQLLYDEIDRNSLFKTSVDDLEDRSIMNICFVMTHGNEDKESAFFDYASSKGMIGIKGHRSVGGFRASTYNALPLDSVQALVEVMQDFEKKY
ncbi:MAG: 3-phosphoserine/phosphohydroxythreonine transaminase [Bacteroidetes bacterium]|jgi:phosphoserine aminotransferase|nr:3-phosphoserine/phosphohydroxythreonine transaminase [Bacteroidota bacterium]